MLARVHRPPKDAAPERKWHSDEGLQPTRPTPRPRCYASRIVPNGGEDSSVDREFLYQEADSHGLKERDASRRNFEFRPAEFHNAEVTVRQPETRPVSQDQLVANVTG
ncbi:hypothetical protein CABS01_16610 [Colletotrichum abscissum]|uniref:uncharacterized protein n=1 Tax=Colletotrichum abscissum TaxID=1671311 RepID=UPI0027D5858B|nr:uncharacterized protein CABS01_16610 [Colletotrichum abscissum]KAK1519290.1 hypothetical protein CABS01_16610 [Colletotrichum abscissum]